MKTLKKLRHDQVHLEAECADKRVQTFVAEYKNLTGETLTPGKRFQVQPSALDNKRGLEGRVYFNATAIQIQALIAAGLKVQGPRTRGYLSDKYSYRIDRNSVFWDLVKLGHRL